MGVALSLHDLRLDAGPVQDEPIKVVLREVADSHCARLALVVEVLQGSPRPPLLRGTPSCRLLELRGPPHFLFWGPNKGPLQEQQIHVLRPQLMELASKSLVRLIVPVVPGRDLGNDEQLFSWQVAFQACPSNVHEVAIHFSSVDGTVAQLQGSENGSSALLPSKPLVTSSPKG
eukprot:CAMPEP_0175642818 /NCGR_PEP_ID=MMETSP0097-20121207/5463_1 /TAXON_ID=311494 /ORGANISM="Alexandrium monilatum, Strain CCMP3105" /LENGTH=173 /DNA_ID=CAMNT_0016948619 /DNA_START=38 /DNA_END=559 /DNA_ORIENTATION=-